jgi:ankyrin repeat protein
MQLARAYSRRFTARGALGALVVVIATAFPRRIVRGEDIRARDLALIEASGRGDSIAVEMLLSQGASVSARGPNGVTSLIAAAYRNHIGIAQRLIAAGADVDVQDDSRQSAYLIATSEGYVELLDVTLAAGADVRRTDSYNGTGLIRAADRGHVEIIRRLLMTLIDVDHINRLGWTALLEAIILGDGGQRHTEVVRLLVAAGANVDIADGHGVSPLAHARRRGFAEIVAILERAGAR